MYCNLIFEAYVYTQIQWKTRFYVILGISLKDMSKDARAQEFLFRRQHPELYPFVCDLCSPQRRFEYPSDMANHERRKHRISISQANPQGATFSDFTLHLTPMNTSACESPLSVVTAKELNTFIQNELEPDTEYNKSCNAVVDRLCQFMQNNFPDLLRPSEVRKVNLFKQK